MLLPPVHDSFHGRQSHLGPSFWGITHEVDLPQYEHDMD